MRPAERRAGIKTDFCHFSVFRTKTYGVDVAAMLLQRHGCDIHAL